MAKKLRPCAPYETSESRLMDHWRAWNVGQIGKDTDRAGDYEYKHHVLFRHNHPHERLVKAPGGQWVQLRQATRTAAVQGSVDIDWGDVDKAGTLYINVPSIGVLSRWEGDEFPVDEMHQRQKYLMLMDLIEHCDRCLHGVSGATLKQDKLGRTYGTNVVDDVIQRCKDSYGRWDFYNETFKLGWQSLPSRYLEELEQDIENRINNYDDPKSASKRNRQKARREAVKALMGN